MSSQPRLFYDSIYDVLRDLVKVAGGAKIVGQLLWPGKSVQEAQTRLLNCLDHNRAEKLSPEDLLVLLKRGRQLGWHHAMEFVNEETGYSKPVPVSPKDELAELQQQFVDAVKTSRHLADRMERLTQTPLQVVEGGKS